MPRHRFSLPLCYPVSDKRFVHHRISSSGAGRSKNLLSSPLVTTRAFPAVVTPSTPARAPPLFRACTRRSPCSVIIRMHPAEVI